ncbi:EamA family transporter, partial [Escherichia coli]|uniref:EamA family transporter n=2 Tax=Enterobacterales TaxID=91347 RepID=UPI0012904C06
KGMTQPPLAVLPLQYAVGLLMCALALPFEPLQVEWRPEFVLPLLWMAVVISVLATFLLYRLIQRGNLVQVTSLFYLIPAVTALLDYLLLGHALAALSLLGMAGIVLGVMLVFRRA